MMHCAKIVESLPALLYGDLPAVEIAAAEAHLAGCAACRREYDALQATRQVLSGLPAPAANVDVARIYAAAAQKQRRRLRRWQYAAAGLSIAASLFACALVLKMEVRVQAHEVSLRWRATAAPTVRASEPAALEPSAPIFAATADDVALMKDLVRALAAEIDGRDQRQQQDLAALQRRLEIVQWQLKQVQAASERGVAALYAMQVNNPKKGE